MMKSYDLQLKSHRAKVTSIGKKSKAISDKNCQLARHEQFKNPGGLSVLNDHNTDPHIRIVQSVLFLNM